MNCWTVCVGTLRPNSGISSVNSADKISSGELSGRESRLAASNPIVVALANVIVSDSLGVLAVSTNARSSLEMNSSKGDIVKGTLMTLLAIPVDCSIARWPNASVEIQDPSVMI